LVEQLVECVVAVFKFGRFDRLHGRDAPSKRKFSVDVAATAVAAAAEATVVAVTVTVIARVVAVGAVAVGEAASFILPAENELYDCGGKEIHRLLCDTQASLVCESEPLLRVAQTPLPKSSVARLSPSIILVNSKLCVRVASADADWQLVI
jgi:hypothetical protein